MSNIPTELKYVVSHEWLHLEEDSIVTIDITHRAQELLGDIAFVRLPEVSASLIAGEQTGMAGSMRAASDVYTPIAGEVATVNKDLPSAPETANSDPYGAGWFSKIKPANPVDYDGPLTVEQYAGEIA